MALQSPVIPEKNTPPPTHQQPNICFVDFLFISFNLQTKTLQSFRNSLGNSQVDFILEDIHDSEDKKGE